MHAKRKRYRKGKGSRTSHMEKIGGERMEILFHAAREKAVAGEYELAASYMRRAKKIGKRLNQKVLGRYKSEYCKNCLVPFVTSELFTLRLRNKIMVITCLNCGEIHRRPFEKPPGKEMKHENRR